jgi:hypothetical protein
MEKEEWDYCLAFDDVYPVIATALSLGVSPEKFDIKQGDNFKRFVLICSWFDIRWWWKPQRGRPPCLVLNGKGNTEVNLKALAAKMREKNIAMPEELAALATPEETAPVTQAPEQKFRAQERRILEIIREMGHDPKSLPKSKQGKRGVKADVWSSAQKETHLFTSRKTFDSAWERLRDGDEISDADDQG